MEFTRLDPAVLKAKLQEKRDQERQNWESTVLPPEHPPEAPSVLPLGVSEAPQRKDGESLPDYIRRRSEWLKAKSAAENAWEIYARKVGSESIESIMSVLDEEQTGADPVTAARDIAALVTGAELLRSLRITPKTQSKRWLNFFCPFHDDKHPSSGVTRDGAVFKCFTCDITITGFEFWCICKGYNQDLTGEYYAQVLSEFLTALGRPNPMRETSGEYE